MQTRAFTLTATLLFSVLFIEGSNPSAQAAIGDWLKGKIKTAKDAAGAAAGTVAEKASDACDTALATAQDAAAQAAAVAQRTKDLAGPIQETLSEVPDMIRNLKDPAETSYDFTRTMLVTAAQSALGVPRRVFFFGGSLDEVRTDIIVPLLGHLRTLRENKTNPEIVAKVLGRLTIYCIETTFKMKAFFQEQIQGGLKAILFSSGKPANPEEGPAHLLTIIRQEVLSHIWAAISTSGLTWKDRIQMIQDTETPLMVAIQRASTQLGWTDLEAEIAVWRAENYPDVVAVVPPLPQIEGPASEDPLP